MIHLTKTEELIVETIREQPCIALKELAYQIDSTPGTVRVLMGSLRLKGYKFRRGLLLVSGVSREP